MTERDGDGDHPLGCRWRPVTADAFAPLDLPPARSRSAATVRTQILTEAYIIGRADADRWVSYSRRRDFYSARRSRYCPTTFTYDLIVPAVDELAASGHLDHEKMPPGNLGWQSRFKASHALMKVLDQTPPALVHAPAECIILRDQDGELVHYDDTARTRRWRRNLKEINEALLSATIGLKGHPICEGDLLRIERANIGAATARLHRVFNQSSFSLGGRFYGGWWQNIPAAYRADIAINGARTVEMDYPRLHPTLLYADCGQPMYGDPYDIPGADRRLVKVAFNTLVNADSRAAAKRVIATEIGGEGAFAKADALLREIETKHSAIAHEFGSGAGRRLMRRDSAMTEYLLFPPLGPSPLDPPASGRPVGSVMMFLPELPQRSLFGSNALAISVLEILGWQGGIAPASIQQALRHEMQRRCLRHADVAERVGVSRSQFENILQGRFGASQRSPRASGTS